MAKLSRSDRQELLRFIGESEKSNLTDNQIINRAAQVSLNDEKDFTEVSQTHHRTYKIPAVSEDTAKKIYTRIASNEKGIGAIRVNISSKPPEETSEEDLAWISTGLSNVDEPEYAEDDLDDVLERYDIDAIYGYEFVFITSLL